MIIRIILYSVRKVNDIRQNQNAVRGSWLDSPKIFHGDIISLLAFFCQVAYFSNLFYRIMHIFRSKI